MQARPFSSSGPTGFPFSSVPPTPCATATRSSLSTTHDLTPSHSSARLPILTPSSHTIVPSRSHLLSFLPFLLWSNWRARLLTLTHTLYLLKTTKPSLPIKFGFIPQDSSVLGPGNVLDRQISSHPWNPAAASTHLNGYSHLPTEQCRTDAAPVTGSRCLPNHGGGEQNSLFHVRV